MNEDPEMMLQIKQYRNFDSTELFSSQNDHKFKIFTALKMENHSMGYFTLKFQTQNFQPFQFQHFGVVISKSLPVFSWLMNPRTQIIVPYLCLSN